MARYTSTGTRMRQMTKAETLRMMSPEGRALAEKRAAERSLPCGSVHPVDGRVCDLVVTHDGSHSVKGTNAGWPKGI